MYAIPLWRTAAMSHINKIEIIQAKILRTVVNAPWYVRNDIRRHTEVPGNPNDQRSNQQERGKIQGKNINTPKPASSGNKGYDLANARMVPRWG